MGISVVQRWLTVGISVVQRWLHDASSPLWVRRIARVRQFDDGHLCCSEVAYCGNLCCSEVTARCIITLMSPEDCSSKAIRWTSLLFRGGWLWASLLFRGGHTRHRLRRKEEWLASLSERVTEPPTNVDIILILIKYNFDRLWPLQCESVCVMLQRLYRIIMADYALRHMD